MAGYRYVLRPEHPLAPTCGKLPEHRVILYESIGPGSHPCHHCGEPVEWMVGVRTKQGALITDHLDGDPTNNSAGNLVPSCHGCNIKQSEHGVSDDELFLVRDGVRHRAEERSCEFCGVDFLVRRAEAKQPNKGRFCSMSCRARNTHAS